MLRATVPRHVRIPDSSIERFLTIIRRFAPLFDVEAARRTLRTCDTLYVFELPLPLTRFQRLRPAIDRALRDASLPAGTGISAGDKREPFVVYRNFATNHRAATATRVL